MDFIPAQGYHFAVFVAWRGKPGLPSKEEWEDPTVVESFSQDFYAVAQRVVGWNGTTRPLTCNYDGQLTEASRQDDFAFVVEVTNVRKPPAESELYKAAVEFMDRRD